MMQDVDTNQDIGNDKQEDTRESTLSTDIEDKASYNLEVLLLGQAHLDKSLQTLGVLQWTKWSCANIVIAFPLLTNSRNPAVAIAPPLLKPRKLTLLNKVYKSDHPPPTKMLLLP